MQLHLLPEGRKLDQKTFSGLIHYPLPNDYTPPRSPYDCLRRFRPPILTYAKDPFKESRSHHPKDALFTDVSAIVGHLLDTHGQAEVKFVLDKTMVANINASLDAKLAGDIDDAKTEDDNLFLGKFMLNEILMIDAANQEELIYESDQVALLRLDGPRLANSWTARHSHWNDTVNVLERNVWTKAPLQGTLIESDFPCWNGQREPVSSSGRMMTRLSNNTTSEQASTSNITNFRSTISHPLPAMTQSGAATLPVSKRRRVEEELTQPAGSTSRSATTAAPNSKHSNSHANNPPTLNPPLPPNEPDNDLIRVLLEFKPLRALPDIILAAIPHFADPLGFMIHQNNAKFTLSFTDQKIQTYLTHQEQTPHSEYVDDAPNVAQTRRKITQAIVQIYEQFHANRCQYLIYHNTSGTVLFEYISPSVIHVSDFIPRVPQGTVSKTTLMTLLVAFGAPASHVPLQGSTSKQQGKKRKADDRGDESDEEQLVFWQVKPAPKVSAGDGAMGAEGEDSQEAEAEVEVEHAMEAEALGDGLTDEALTAQDGTGSDKAQPERFSVHSHPDLHLPRFRRSLDIEHLIFSELPVTPYPCLKACSVRLFIPTLVNSPHTCNPTPAEDHLDVALGNHLGAGHVWEVFEACVHAPAHALFCPGAGSHQMSSPLRLLAKGTMKYRPPAGVAPRLIPLKSINNALSSTDALGFDQDVPSTSTSSGRAAPTLSLLPSSAPTSPPGQSGKYHFHPSKSDLFTSGRLRDCGMQNMVVKICMPSAFDKPRFSRLQDESDREYDQKEVQLAVANEINIYVAHHEKLNSVVPQVYALWCGYTGDRRRDMVYVMIMERVGEAVADRWFKLSSEDRDNIRTLYAKLHIAGITHGDIQLRHIRRRLDDPSQLVLIDFDQAKINDAVSMKEEKKNLKCFLSFGVPDEELDEDSDDGTKTEYP